MPIRIREYQWFKLKSDKFYFEDDEIVRPLFFTVYMASNIIEQLEGNLFSLIILPFLLICLGLMGFVVDIIFLVPKILWSVKLK